MKKRAYNNALLHEKTRMYKSAYMANLKALPANATEILAEDWPKDESFQNQILEILCHMLITVYYDMNGGGWGWLHHFNTTDTRLNEKVTLYITLHCSFVLCLFSQFSTSTVMHFKITQRMINSSPFFSF